MVDRFCQPFSSNTSRNKGVLHVLGANCPKAQVDNLCAKRHSGELERCTGEARLAPTEIIGKHSLQTQFFAMANLTFALSRLTTIEILETRVVQLP